ncbi:hypothetical protein HNQ85_003486 [Anoxybacillus calidus]|uniref:Transposase n=1 Tax=[Anoxybacillus] calidus TaxID=575178 RepID=A0A7V9Z392_9BACL|nr:hypothetical protein [Anoxybacillus calidus]MBA2873148.1 hypothetical protein [Anoxybacillus calidus]
MSDTASRNECISMGLKHIQPNDLRMVMSYVMAPAFYHNVMVAEEVIERLPHPYTLEDKGYVSKSLKEKLQQNYRVSLRTPSRKNSKTYISHEFQQWIRQETENCRNGVFGFNRLVSIDFHLFEESLWV